MALSPQELAKLQEVLKDPVVALPRWGKVFDKKSSRKVPYRPDAITVRMQWDILRYFGDAPRDETTGQTLWYNVLKGRQTGASTSTEYAAYPLTSWVHGWEHVCLHPTTLVLRPDGNMAQLGDLQVGDEVVTHTGVTAPVKHKWTSRHETFEVRVQGHSEPVVCSGDHHHYTPDGFRPTGALRGGDRLGFPVRTLSEGGELPDGVRPTKPLGRLVGLYLAEGSLPRVERLSYAVHDDEVERTVDWLLEAGFDRDKVKVVNTKKSHGSEVIVYSRDTARWFDEVCGRTTEKHLPRAWWALGRDFVEGLLEGYFQGDGYARYEPSKSSAQVIAPTVNEGIATGIRDAVASAHGIWLSTRKAKPRARRRTTWYLQASGSDARDLAPKIGYGQLGPPLKRARMQRYNAPIFEGGYVWLFVKSVEPTGVEEDLIDIEVDHEDHSFLLHQFATSNCIADNKDRANYLHNRVQFLHNNWPKEYRQATVSTTETRQLSFRHGGAMRVLSGKAGAVGLGQSPNSMHISEMPFWDDAEGAMEKLIPSMLTQDEALIINESTPASANEPSTGFWKQSYFDGKLGLGRWRSRFYPFWDGVLNRRAWGKGEKFTTEELRLLERYGPAGLTIEHLAFRRYAIDSMPRLRKNPELFKVWYPFDDRTCWVTVGSEFLRADLLEQRDHRLVDYDGNEYQEFEAPDEHAAYVIGVDPSGWGQNHGAFVVLKVWADDGEEVVATFSTPSDPMKFNEKLLETARRYNNAVVNIERNGVGAGTIQYMEAMGYRNLYYDDSMKPGITKFSHDQMLNVLGEALLTSLTLRSGRLADQVISYRGDMEVKSSIRTVILARGKEDTRRRTKEHWDLLSALCIALLGRDQVPARTKYRATKQRALEFSEMGYDAIQEYLNQMAETPNRRFRARGRR